MRPEVDIHAGKKATCRLRRCVTIIADLVGSGALEDVIRVVGVAELALGQPYLTSADKIMAHGNVHKKSVCCATRMLRISTSARRLPSLVSTRL